MKWIVAIMICLLPACATAEWLTCDVAQTPVTSVEVEVTKDGVVTLYPGVYIIDGLRAKILDVINFTSGTYTFRAHWAEGEWWSDWSTPATFSKPGKAGNFKIVK